MPSPYDKAIRHAEDCAKRGLGVESCGYSDPAYRSVWLKAFENKQQVVMDFDKSKEQERDK